MLQIFGRRCTMRILYKVFAKKLFGVNYEKLIQTSLIYFIVFLGLYLADFKIQIASFMFYFLVSTFTAGTMWQTLSSEDNAADMQHIVMLPFCNRKLVFSYITALGIDTIFTKTIALFSVLLAVSNPTVTEIFGSILCAVNAVLMTAAIYLIKKYWCGVWTVVVIAIILFLGKDVYIIPLLVLNGMFSVLLLQNADGYRFYCQKKEKNDTIRGQRYGSIWRYFFRYLNCHKNYMMNIAALWGIACVLPIFFEQIESWFAVSFSFAILSFNTPICILLSCDRDFEQAVRFLPGQKKAFAVPYGMFIFLCNLTADIVFLCSFQIQKGGISLLMAAGAVFFALQSAIVSVLLEWFYPIRNWKMESDLWHHPRKYIVPAVMLLLAGAVGILPILMPVLLILLAVEVAGIMRK